MDHAAGRAMPAQQLDDTFRGTAGMDDERLSGVRGQTDMRDEDAFLALRIEIGYEKIQTAFAHGHALGPRDPTG